MFLFSLSEPTDFIIDPIISCFSLPLSAQITTLGLVSFFNGISTFIGYLMQKNLIEEQQWHHLTKSWGIRRFIWNYKSESKVVQNFVNMKHNLAAPFAFTKVVKMTNHTGLWDVKHPVTLRELVTKFISMVLSTASESKILGLPDLAWLSRCLQFEQNFWNHLVIVLWSTVP